MNKAVQSKTTRGVNEDWLPLEIVCDGIEEDRAPDVYPVRRSSEGGACSVASPAIPYHTLPWPAMPYHTLPYPAMAQLPEASANGARLTCYHHEIDYGEAAGMHID